MPYFQEIWYGVLIIGIIVMVMLSITNLGKNTSSFIRILIAANIWTLLFILSTVNAYMVDGLSSPFIMFGVGVLLGIGAMMVAWKKKISSQ